MTLESLGRTKPLSTGGEERGPWISAPLSTAGAASGSETGSKDEPSVAGSSSSSCRASALGASRSIALPSGSNTAKVLGSRALKIKRLFSSGGNSTAVEQKNESNDSAKRKLSNNFLPETFPGASMAAKAF